MRIAQRLYEEGYITYMRTDSVNLSQEAINSAKDFIEKEFGGRIFFAKKLYHEIFICTRSARSDSSD
jgi:DNA topoisomerase IA